MATDAEALAALQLLKVLREGTRGKLLELQKTIKHLPKSIPLGKPNGIIATHFSSFELLDPDEGPWYTIDKACVRVFQGASEDVVTCGKNGMDLVHKFLAHFFTLPGMELHGSYRLLSDRITSLIELISKVYVSESFSWNLVNCCSQKSWDQDCNK